jgi:PAS domain S-box-containing protein
MDYSLLSKEELIKIIDVLNGRLEVHNQRVNLLSSVAVDLNEISDKENYWKDILDALPISVSLHDSVGYTTLNKFGQNLSGYSEEEWIKMAEEERALIFEFPAKPETLVFFEMMTRQGKNPEKDMIELEFKLRTKEGKWLWLYSTNSFVFNPAKKDFEVLTAALDVTERKNHELEIEKLNSELEELIARERVLAEEKQAWLEQQILDKNKELNRLAVLLTEKNNCLVRLKKQASSLSDVSAKELKLMAQKIIKTIDDKLNSQSAWNTFEIQFETANPQFIKTLLELYQNLTQTEVRICTMLKIELSTKAIATILNLSNRTIDAHRYSIRKKMNLGPKEQLSLTLNSI